jgi:hypothetical protein
MRGPDGTINGPEHVPKTESALPLSIGESLSRRKKDVGTNRIGI